MAGSAGLISPVSAVDVPAPDGGPPSCTAADGSAAVVAAGACCPGVDCGLPQAAASHTVPITTNCLKGMAPSSCRSPMNRIVHDRWVEPSTDCKTTARVSPGSQVVAMAPRHLISGATPKYRSRAPGSPYVEGPLRPSIRVLIPDSSPRQATPRRHRTC